MWGSREVHTHTHTLTHTILLEAYHLMRELEITTPCKKCYSGGVDIQKTLGVQRKD